MNIFNFIQLLRTIYGKKLPNIDFIESLGLLAVKIGQTYALRFDFLPERNCQQLAQLYRFTSKMPGESFEKLLNSLVDSSWKENFREINKNPLASASVGQVHEAFLNDNSKVVIKVIKSDFEQNFIRDVKSLRSILKWVLRFYPKLAYVADPMGILDTIEKGTLDELDLRKEAFGQKALLQIVEMESARFNLSKLYFPKIYPHLSGSRYMVSEFVEGKTFDELLTERKLSYNTLLDLFHLHGFFVFCIGTFHGDIHPGNIILTPEEKIAFIDTGAISSVSKKMGHGLFHFFDALSQYAYDACAVALNSMAEVPIDGKRFDNFKKQFLTLYKDFTNSTVSDVSLTKRMMETIKLGVNSGMVFERGMYPIIKSLMYLDGMVLRCNPKALLVRDMRMFIDEFKRVLD